MEKLLAELSFIYGFETFFVLRFFLFSILFNYNFNTKHYLTTLPMFMLKSYFYSFISFS